MSIAMKNSGGTFKQTGIAFLLNARAQLHEWVEDKRSMFQNLPHDNKQRALTSLQEVTRKVRDEALRSPRSNSSGNRNGVVSQDSPPVSHMQRCFSDTSQDSTMLSNAKEDSISDCSPQHVASNGVSVKPKPFLKKKSGLERYAPGAAAKRKSLSVIKESRSESSEGSLVQTEPTSAPFTSFASKPRRVAFQDRDISIVDRPSSQTARSRDRAYEPIQEEGGLFSDVGDFGITQKTPPCAESPNTKNERRELAEFELLESCAQNSSFNSDCSLVQNIISGDKIQEVREPEQVFELPDFMIISKNSLDDLGAKQNRLASYVEEIQEKKRIAQTLSSETDLKISSVRKELESMTSLRSIPAIVSSVDKLQDLPTLRHLQSLPNIEYESSNSFHSDPPGVEEKAETKESVAETRGASTENSTTSTVSLYKIDSTQMALQKEIEIYQKLNAELEEKKKKNKQTEKELNNLRKEKEAAKIKSELEIENQRKQLKRERETFQRMKKLGGGIPDRRLREEMNALRKENEQLKKELKQLTVRHNNAAQRFRTSLAEAESQRDTLQLRNINLQEECHDLMTALKREKTKFTNSLKDHTRSVSGTKETRKKSTASQTDQRTARSSNGDCNVRSPKRVPSSSKSDDSRPKVRFDLNPSEYCDKDSMSDESQETVVEAQNFSHIGSGDFASYHASDVEEGVEEIQYDDRIEKIYPSGNREISYRKGTVIFIKADGEIQKRYVNGDVKTVYPDGKEVYEYEAGTIRIQHPNGLIETKFPDGQIQNFHPDGSKEIKFPDGSVQHEDSRGFREIFTSGGAKVTHDLDGTQTILYKNGDKEIVTETCRRKEFKDGRVKIIYNSGKREVRYPDGRVRVKNDKGKLIMDTDAYAAVS